MDKNIQTIYNDFGDLERYQNGVLIETISYLDGKILSKTEYQNDEVIRVSDYLNEKLCSVSEYKYGEEVRIFHYNNEKLTMMSEYEDGEEICSSSYDENEKIFMKTEYENEEEIRNLVYSDGKLTSLIEFKNGEQILNIFYKNNQIIKYRQLLNDEILKEVKFDKGELLYIKDYSGNNYQTIVFENKKIIKISKYKDTDIIDIVKRKNIINVEVLENRYFTYLNDFVDKYNIENI